MNGINERCCMDVMEVSCLEMWPPTKTCVVITWNVHVIIMVR
jgi:hypothetical protein